ncbi:neprilysin-3-like [Haemaphysalis longicornis]
MSAHVDDFGWNFISGPVFGLLAAISWCAPIIVLVVYIIAGAYLDFRVTVNAATLIEGYPLPRVDDLFALVNGQVFQTLDVRQAHNQLALDEEAKQVTVLNSHKGLFCSYCYNISYAIFGPAIAAPILFKSANSSKLDQVRRMSETLVKEIQISIESSTWLRRETRAHLSRKLGLVKWKLGYAPGLEDWPGLEKRFRDYPTATGVFLADYVKTKEVHARTLYRIIASNNSFESNNFKSDVVGAFLKGPSTLFVSAASVLSPLFCYGAPPEVNYGLLGSLVLRNLMSAFRPTNILYDGNGSTIPWTTEERGIFEDRYQCDLFTEEANSSSGPAATISIGAKALFRAYKRAASGKGKSTYALPHLEALAEDQLFFVSRCFLYCDDPPVESHTCNMMARHSSEFADVFQCEREEIRDRCDMW